jgi:hypothetical protein
MINKIKNHILRFVVIYTLACIVLYPFTDIFDIWYHVGMVLGIGISETFYFFEKRKEKAKYKIED